MEHINDILKFSTFLLNQIYSRFCRFLKLHAKYGQKFENLQKSESLALFGMNLQNRQKFAKMRKHNIERNFWNCDFSSLFRKKNDKQRVFCDFFKNSGFWQNIAIVFSMKFPF